MALLGFSALLSLLAVGCFGLPEISRWQEHVVKNTTLSMEKSMFELSEIFLKIYCREKFDLRISWMLLQSSCIELFLDFNITDVAKNMDSFVSNSVKVTVEKGSSKFSCNPSHPTYVEGPSNPEKYRMKATGPLATVSNAGAHLLVLKVECPSADTFLDATVEVEMRNPDGTYLSAVEFPFLPFNGVMGLLYLISVTIWLTLLIRYWHDVMRIQFCIGVVLMLGLWEHLTLFAIFETIRKSGQVSPSAVYFAEMIACSKRTLARLLVLIACLGYGVTKPRLGAIWFRRCLLIGLVYFFLVTIEGLTRAAHPRFVTTYFRLATLLPLLCLDVGIMWWIFIYLARTLRETRMRHNLIKHKLYRNFSYVLLGVSIASLVFMIWSLGVFKHRACIESWRYLWIDDAFWQFLFVLILAVIIVLWRPTASNREYAYSLLDVGTVDDGFDDADEEVLLDRVGHENDDSEKVRSRLLDDIGGNRKPTPDAETQMPSHHQTRTAVPATIVERIGMEVSSSPGEQAPVWKVD
ncbi:unnamed protein product [Dicrocoelium dendriticum]|nr:unnamed protein product [Dicrocoelium dendriticum]